MLKQTIIYLLLSILVVVFAEYAHTIVIYINSLYMYVNMKLAPIFNGSQLGVMIRHIFSLVLIPVVIALIPALIYRLVKGRQMPYFFQLTWLLWLVIVLSKIVTR